MVYMLKLTLKTSISEGLHAAQKADVNIGAGMWTGIIYVTHSTQTQMVFSCERPLHLYFRFSHKHTQMSPVVTGTTGHQSKKITNTSWHYIIITIQFQLF